jgi:DNA processing protein
MQLALRSEGPALSTISPRLEIGAYEALWLESGATFKTLADKFAADPTALPSDFVPPSRAHEAADAVFAAMKKAGVHQFGVRINHAGDYPRKLRDARHPVEMLYYRGGWELTETRSIAIVGSRQASPEGRQRAGQLARAFVAKDFTVVSGLAEGIDTAAHTAALEAKGRTIAVVGTPLNTVYPKINRELQEIIANNHLVISQVPVLRYAKQGPQQNRLFFPERNVTMSALTEATVIVEAGETSGTLTQARAALHQGRKLFILESCFNNPAITWPERYLREGAVRVRTIDDIWATLG